MEGPARRAPPPSSGVDGRGVETAIPSGGRGEKEGEGGRGEGGVCEGSRRMLYT